MQEKIRLAIESAIRAGLANSGGDWFADTTDGQEIEFRPNEDGHICVQVEDNNGDEQEYSFRVVLVSR